MMVWIKFIIVFCLIVVVTMVVTAFSIGTTNAWYLGGNFVDGWNAGWHKWWLMMIGGIGVAFHSIWNA